MNECEWKAAEREAARQELIRREAEARKAEAAWCAAWFSMADRLGLKETQSF